ncbi:hypothetical protein ADK76_08045 [Streptomyces griseoflavus]|uniref:hypothetical protein n=1 Tax=Streptomyces rimosus TaxID=1927 RepID=UPI0004CAC433|nr:hypothetical protein [Streptomyces rimosus]KOG64953.1 hypothetical protein ADK76_08045 [Streptomyces griseoflavus]
MDPVRIIRLLAVALAVAVAVICALLAGIWQYASAGDANQAVRTAGYTFVSAVTVVFLIMTYLKTQ